MNMLECPVCQSMLKLSIGYTGCDWLCEAGEESGYDYEVSLNCVNGSCARVFTLGHMKNGNDFSEVKDHKPYVREYEE